MWHPVVIYIYYLCLAEQRGDDESEHDQTETEGKDEDKEDDRVWAGDQDGDGHQGHHYGEDQHHDGVDQEPGYPGKL